MGGGVLLLQGIMGKNVFYSIARSGRFWERAYFYPRTWLLLTSRDSGSLANFSWVFVSVLLLETLGKPVCLANCGILAFGWLVVLGMELRTSHMLGRHSTSERKPCAAAVTPPKSEYF